MSKSDDSITIILPRTLYEKIEKRVKNSKEFESVSAYITYVLEQVIAEVEAEAEVYSKEDRRQIEQRLKALGYLD